MSAICDHHIVPVDRVGDCPICWARRRGVPMREGVGLYFSGVCYLAWRSDAGRWHVDEVQSAADVMARIRC